MRTIDRWWLLLLPLLDRIIMVRGFTTKLNRRHDRPRNKQNLVAARHPQAFLLASTTRATTTDSHKPQEQERQEIEDALQAHLWQAQPFSIVATVVQSVLDPNHNNNNNNEHSTAQQRPRPMLHTIPSFPAGRRHLDDNNNNNNNHHHHHHHHQVDMEQYEELFDAILMRPEIGENGGVPKAAAKKPNLQPDINPNLKYQRRSFALTLAYQGDFFCGWQRQANDTLPSVQQTVEEWLQPLYATKPTKKHTLHHHSTPPTTPRVNIRVCGRTDAGVHAIGQVARFRTMMDPNAWPSVLSNTAAITTTSAAMHDQWLLDYMNQHPLAGTAFRCTQVRQVSSNFHPTFGATCRAYLYLIDGSCLEHVLRQHVLGAPQHATTNDHHTTTRLLRQLVSRLNAMLQPLQGQELDYFGMSYGRMKTKTTLCTLHLARASLVQQDVTTHADNNTALGIQLVGNRFLRRMVRILVATAIREAVLDMRGHTTTTSSEDAMLDDDTLLELLLHRDRTARPAPPQGLVFVGTRIVVDGDEMIP